MSKILIIGNGFDLFHHLPTKYHHFISIMQTIEKHEFTKDLNFENLFGKHFKDKYLGDYNSIINNYNTVSFNFSHKKIKLISEFLDANLWYNHFKNVTEIDTWIDFEMEVENILNQFEIFDKHQDKRVVKKNAFDDYLFDFTDFELFQIIEKKSIGQIPFSLNEKYIIQRNSSIDIKKMLEDLATSFEDFIVIFNLYLVDVVSVFYIKIKQKPKIPFQLIDEIYTFNYTPTLENIYEVDKSKVVYLHGQINEECNKQNIVLGVSEISNDVKKHKGYVFTKYYQKIRKRTNRNFIDLPSKDTPAFNETLFFVFGHSLDSSDKEYIQDLFKFLEFDSTGMSKMVIFYLDPTDYNRKLENLFSIIDKNVILKMNRNRRLDFVELTTNNVINEFNRQIKTHQILF